MHHIFEELMPQPLLVGIIISLKLSGGLSLCLLQKKVIFQNKQNLQFKQTFKFSHMDSTKRVALCRGDVLLQKASHDAPGPSFPFFREKFLFVSKIVLETKIIRINI